MIDITPQIAVLNAAVMESVVCDGTTAWSPGAVASQSPSRPGAVYAGVRPRVGAGVPRPSFTRG